MKELEVKSATVEQAIAQGLEELNVEEKDVKIEVISKGGFLKKAVVKLTVIQNNEPKVATVPADAPVFDRVVVATVKKVAPSPTAAPAQAYSPNPVVAPKKTASARKEASAVDTTATKDAPIIDKVVSATVKKVAPSPTTTPAQAYSPKPVVETPYDALDEDEKVCVDFLTKLFAKMNLECALKITSNNDKLAILICGADTNLAIGYRGETLDSLQYLTLLVANKNTRFRKKLIIDAEGYREKRAEALTILSKNLALKVARTSCAVELEPMNPFERRVIHTSLQDDASVITSSEGVEPNRYVVISPKPREEDSVDMYNQSSKQNFKKSGVGKTRSFGNKKRRF